jgi:hypothetical protein
LISAIPFRVSSHIEERIALFIVTPGSDRSVSLFLVVCSAACVAA